LELLARASFDVKERIADQKSGVCQSSKRERIPDLLTDG
jgi:hypothetical protein